MESNQNRKTKTHRNIHTKPWNQKPNGMEFVTEDEKSREEKKHNNNNNNK